MKKATERKRTKKQPEPSMGSLKEMPEVDFTKVRVRSNPYAARLIANDPPGPGRV